MIFPKKDARKAFFFFFLSLNRIKLLYTRIKSLAIGESAEKKSGDRCIALSRRQPFSSFFFISGPFAVGRPRGGFSLSLYISLGLCIGHTYTRTREQSSSNESFSICVCVCDWCPSLVILVCVRQSHLARRVVATAADDDCRYGIFPREWLMNYKRRDFSAWRSDRQIEREKKKKSRTFQLYRCSSGVLYI